MLIRTIIRLPNTPLQFNNANLRCVLCQIQPNYRERERKCQRGKAREQKLLIFPSFGLLRIRYRKEIKIGIRSCNKTAAFTVP